MTHPITPPPELVKQWRNEGYSMHKPVVLTTYVANCAAQWGADMELEACVGWNNDYRNGLGRELRAARRPKPLSLKEQALTALTRYATGETMSLTNKSIDTIRLALEQLND